MAHVRSAAQQRTRRVVRDRRGRGLRGGMFGATVPATRTRREAFTETAAGIFARLRAKAPSELADVVLACDEAPQPGEPRPVLGRVYPASKHRAAHIVIYRLPIIERARDADLHQLVHDVLVDEVCTLLGREPEDFR